jgi:hypothetical protein
VIERSFDFEQSVLVSRLNSWPENRAGGRPAPPCRRRSRAARCAPPGGRAPRAHRHASPAAPPPDAAVRIERRRRIEQLAATCSASRERIASGVRAGAPSTARISRSIVDMSGAHLRQRRLVDTHLDGGRIALRIEIDGQTSALKTLPRRLAHFGLQLIVPQRQPNAHIEPTPVDALHLPVPAHALLRAVRAGKTGHTVERHGTPKANGKPKAVRKP